MPSPAEGPSRRLPAPCRQESCRTRQESSRIVAFRILRSPKAPPTSSAWNPEGPRCRRLLTTPVESPSTLDDSPLTAPPGPEGPPRRPRPARRRLQEHRLPGPKALQGARNPHDAAWRCGCTGARINIPCVLIVARSKTLMPRARAGPSACGAEPPPRAKLFLPLHNLQLSP